jgi:hypothetical protein
MIDQRARRVARARRRRDRQAAARAELPYGAGRQGHAHGRHAPGPDREASATDHNRLSSKPQLDRSGTSRHCALAAAQGDPGGAPSLDWRSVANDAREGSRVAVAQAVHAAVLASHAPPRRHSPNVHRPPSPSADGQLHAEMGRPALASARELEARPVDVNSSAQTAPPDGEDAADPRRCARRRLEAASMPPGATVQSERALFHVPAASSVDELHGPGAFMQKLAQRDPAAAKIQTALKRCRDRQIDDAGARSDPARIA